MYIYDIMYFLTGTWHEARGKITCGFKIKMLEEIYIRIHDCKQAVIDHRWNYPDMLCTYWRFYIDDRDGGLVTSGKHVLQLKKNTMYLIPAWLRVSLSNDSPIKHFYVHFDLLGLTGFLCRTLFPTPMALGEEDFNKFSDMLGNSKSVALDRFILECRIKSVIYELLSRYLERTPENRRPLLNTLIPAAGRYSKIFEYIDNNLNEKINNHVLADICEKSEGHFIRDFTVSTGITPAKYVTERRISKAIEMLVFTDQSIDQIAADTGFTDRFHFSKLFRSITGTPPAAYRKHAIRE